MIIVVDDEDRENEAIYLWLPKRQPEAVNFMAKYGRGLICVPITEERSKYLQLDLMVQNSTDKRKLHLRYL